MHTYCTHLHLVCMCTYTYTCMHTTYTLIHRCIYIHIDTHIYASMHAHTYVYEIGELTLRYFYGTGLPIKERTFSITHLTCTVLSTEQLRIKNCADSPDHGVMDASNLYLNIECYCCNFILYMALNLSFNISSLE